jgi:type II secretory pathway pseudopilin PulG
MFSLIITIISIALVAALALATLYFGGDAFNQGSAKAAAATIVNQASQINGANTLHFLDKQEYNTVLSDGVTDPANDLVDGGYLSSLPSPGDSATGDYAVTAVDDPSITLDGVKKAVCEAVNIQSGLMQSGDSIPVVDGTTNSVLSDAVTTQFGCAEDGTGAGAYTFLFK